MITKETVNVANTDTELNGQHVERIHTIKYLGSIITSRNKTEYDVKDKTATADWCFHTLNKMLSKM
jgi:hypothetical protein